MPRLGTAVKVPSRGMVMTDGALVGALHTYVYNPRWLTPRRGSGRAGFTIDWEWWRAMCPEDGKASSGRSAAMPATTAASTSASPKRIAVPVPAMLYARKQSATITSHSIQLYPLPTLSATWVDVVMLLGNGEKPGYRTDRIK